MEEKLDEILQKYCIAAPGDSTADKLLGASFAAINPDGITTASAGLLSPTSDAPFLPTSVTWLASLTKLLTATAVLHLVAHPSSTLALDSDLRAVVPELTHLQILRGFDSTDAPILEDNVVPITLRHLLSQTAGYGIDVADPDLSKWALVTNRSASSLDWTYEGIKMPLKFAPGGGWYYGSSMEWAGVVIERVSGLLLGEYMHTHLFGPLGMRDTTFRPARYEGEGMPTWTWRDNKTHTLTVSPPNIAGPDHELDSGGSGLFSSAKDYAVLIHSLLAKTAPLSESDIALLWTPQLDDNQRTMLTAIADEYRFMFAPEIPPNTPLDHGLGGLISLADVPGKRRAGTVMWSGNCNGRWWIDEKSGVGGVVIVSVQPHGDGVVNRMWDELEKEVYRHVS